MIDSKQEERDWRNSRAMVEIHPRKHNGEEFEIKEKDEEHEKYGNEDKRK